MTDILPPAGWPSVRQLETNEFATGGANGNMNEQAKSLAARSELLKQYAALPYESKTGGYALNERVQLATGDIVRSTIASNVNNPNENMTGWRQPNDLTGNPLVCGAKGNGVFDDTLAIQECADKFRYLDMRNANWKTTGKIKLRSGTVVDLRGAYLSANNANEPIFEFKNAGDGLSILGGGGYVYGTADSFLKCSGKTYQPTMQTDYARQIRLDGVHVSSENIDKFLDFDKAVRQVFMTKVFAYVKNGMFCNGKCVEIEIYGSIIYGAKGAGDLTTYGIKYVSPGGGRWYNEGLHITDSTIDNFGTTFDIRDIYAMSVTGGHIGAAIQSDGNNAPGALVAKFGQPTSTACRNIKFANVNIYGNIEFVPVSGIEYFAKFTGCTSESFSDGAITIRNNASQIAVSDHTFHSSFNGVGVLGISNNHNITVDGTTADSSLIGVVHLRGANGDNCLVANINYAGTNDPVYFERPIRIKNIPVSAINTINELQRFNTGDITGNYAVGSTIATVIGSFAKGETGVIVCELGFSGANAGTQVLDVSVPSGMVVPSGGSWNSRFIMPSSLSGRISVAIPYCVQSSIVDGSLTLTNYEGNPIDVNYHSYFGFKRDW